jgi:sec-independent protein translocase protein TatB
MVAMGAAPQIYAASIGIQDSIFLMLLALVVFGPRRLPEIGRQIGKLMYEFRKVSNDFKFQMEEELRASEEAERQRKLQASLPPPAQAALPETPLETPPETSAEAAPAIAETASEAVPEHAASESAVSESAVPESAFSEPAVPEPAAAAPQIQIQPPSIGEQVAAARPFRASVPAEPEIAAHPDAETAGDSGHEAPSGVSAETETHHG